MADQKVVVRVLSAIWSYYHPFAKGMIKGLIAWHAMDWMLPKAELSARLTLYFILAIGTWVLYDRAGDWLRETAEQWRASWAEQGEVPFAVTAALFSICIALIGGICGAAWAGWLS